MLTVVILAKNEAKNLAELLPSLDFADEIMVIDDNSTDGTKKICVKFKVKVVTHRLNNDYAESRNYGLSLIQKGWVLFLDADERLISGASDELLNIVDKDEDFGYQLKRVDVFYQKELKYGETGDTWLTRLAKFDAGKWEGKVHETWRVVQVKKLKHHILHYSHDSVKQLFSSIRGYARIRASELEAQRKYWRSDQQLLFPIIKFLYLMVIKLGILDGWRGWVMGTAMAYHSFLVRWYLWDLPFLKLPNRLKIWRMFMVVPICLLPWGQLLRGSVLGISIYGHEIFMILAVAMTWIWGGFNFKKFRILNKQMIPLIVFSAVLGLSYLVSLLRGMPMAGGLYLLRWYLYVAYLGSLLFGVTNGFKVSIKGLINYYAGMLLVLGWVQFGLWPDTRSLSLLGWDDHYYRMIGSVFDPNFLGLLLVLIILWAVFKVKKSISITVVSMALVSLAATYSRGSFLSLLLVVLIYIGFNLRWKLVSLAVMASLLIVLTIGLLPKPGGESTNLRRWYSATSRINSANMGLQVFRSYPLLGIGFNQHQTLYNLEGHFGAEYHPKSPDNSFIFVMETAGLLGLITFLWLIAGWWNNNPAWIYRLSLVAILSHSMINNSFFYSFVLMWWWLLLAEYKQEQISANS